MKNNKTTITALGIMAFLALCFTGIKAQSHEKNKRDFYEIKVYHLKNQDQINRTEQYLKTAYLPALHRTGIHKAGVFKSIDNDTAADKRIYVFIPSASLHKLSTLDDQLWNDEQLKRDGAGYITAAYNDAPYERIETIILRAFADMPQFATPSLTASASERVYELRSYEGATENFYHQKVKMFNAGNEIGIFTRLNFNAVFYAEVVAGSHMPNLMYMTTFNNKADRDEHWKKFGNDPEWKRLSSLPEYQHTVSKADILFVRPTEYSDF